MAAPRNAFNVLFTTLLSGEGPENPTPMRGPVVVTYSRYDRATGFWHMTAERSRGIGNAGVRLAPAHIHNIRLLPLDHVYTRADLDHPIVNVDASWRFRRRGLKFSGAHSDIYYPESAHLILSIAELCRW
jgi:hypothetical protein